MPFLKAYNCANSNAIYLHKLYFYYTGEMARRGVTQELIDETRASTEVQMLRDLQKIASLGGDLEYKDHQGATPVCMLYIDLKKKKN